MKWVLFDTSWLAYRALHATKDLEWEGEPTGVLYGFFEEMRAVCSEPRIQSNQVALFFDHRRSYRRKSFPAYKANRAVKTPEEQAQVEMVHQQMRRLRKEILPAIGVPFYRRPGLESDDLIAAAARWIDEESHQKDCEGVIVTADKDLLQCVTNSVFWYNPQRNEWLDPMGVVRKVGVEPVLWAEAKAIAGCRGDGVPGVHGVGERTAVQYLLRLLNPKHKRFQAIISKEGQAIIKRNRPLVVLPHSRTKPFVLSPPSWNARAFEEQARRLGFFSAIGEGRRAKEWERFLSGDFASGRQVPRARTRLVQGDLFP